MEAAEKKQQYTTAGSETEQVGFSAYELPFTPSFAYTHMATQGSGCCAKEWMIDTDDRQISGFWNCSPEVGSPLSLVDRPFHHTVTRMEMKAA
jgi:hypothetical protein